MNFKKFFRALPCRTLLSLLLVMMVFATPAICLDSEDSQIFITGFNSYQKKDYQTTVDKMSTLLKTYPDTPLRDMAIFWLARANFKAGHKEDAARYMAQFFKEYPDSPLKGTVEDELVTLAGKYARGESVASAAKGTGEKPTSTAVAKEPSEAEAKAAAQRAEEMRLAVQKAEAEKKAAAEKSAAEKAAREKAEAERIAAAKQAEEMRLVAEQAAAEKAREEKVAAEKAAAEKAAAEKAAQEKAEAERVAAAKKAEELRIAAEKAAAENARQEKIAAEKAAAEKAAAEKAAAEKAAQEKAEAERIAAAKKAEEMRLAAEKAAAEKARQEKVAAEKAAAEKAAAEKAAAEKAAQEKAEAERIASAKKAEELRLAAEKAAAEKARQEKIAAEKAAAEKAAQEKAEAERVAAAKKAEALRIAAEKAAAEKARQEKIAAEKAAVEKAAVEKAAQEKTEAERIAAAKKAEEMRLAAAEKAAQAEKRSKSASAANGRKKEKTKSSKSVTLREKAIAEYKSVIDRFPGSAAAASAASKLKDLGIVYPAAAAAGAQGENAKVLSLEVGQFADLDFTVTPPAQALESGKRVTIPFEIVNLGNGTDTFYLESGFPAEFDVQFTSAAQPAHPINVTPQLKTGDRFRALMSLTVPHTVVDGQKAGYPIKVGSGFSPEISQSKELRLAFAAPLLRAVIKAEKNQLQPGQKIAYRLDLLNIGTSAARGVTLRLNYPPQYEPVNLVPAGFKPEMKAALVLDGLQLNSGESKAFNLTFQLKDDALALQELFLRADVINTELEKRDSFISPSTVVAGVSGVSVRTSAEKLVVIPGQTMRVPMVITNTGNIREDFSIKPVIPADVTYSFYQDLNRDGKKQDTEPLINHVGPLAPKEEAYVVLEVNTPASQQDGSIMPITVGLEPEADPSKSVALNVRLVYSRPVLDLLMTGKGGKVKPGEVSSFELSCTNRGSNLAKVVDVQTVMPEQLAVVSADPAFTSGANGVYTWRFDDVGSGEKRAIKITYKVKTGTIVGTNMQIKNTLKYQDLLGMNY